LASMSYPRVPKRSGTEAQDKDRRDEDVCKRVVALDPAIRVAALVDGDEVRSFAQSAKASNVLGEDSVFRTKIGLWVRIIVEMAKQTGKLFGATESVSVNHKGLKLVIVPLSEERSLGLSLDKSANTDNIVSKITEIPGIRQTSF
jgi:hypothetical protein